MTGGWRARARCRPGPETSQEAVEAIAEGFFPLDRHSRVAWAAKEVCGHCPVQQECLSEALEQGYDYGIWGGLDEHERRAMRCARIGRAA